MLILFEQVGETQLGGGGKYEYRWGAECMECSIDHRVDMQSDKKWKTAYHPYREGSEERCV